jgi:CheY-like chemotaxis protein
MEAGMDLFLSKPVQLDTLRQALNQAGALRAS